MRRNYSYDLDLQQPTDKIDLHFFAREGIRFFAERPIDIEPNINHYNF